MGEVVTKDVDVFEKSVSDRIDKITKHLEEEKAARLTGAGQQTQVYGNRSDSFEQKCLASFGRKHVNELFNINVAQPHRFDHVKPEYKSAIISLKEALDINRIIAQTKYAGAKDLNEDHPVHCKQTLETKFAREELIPMIKAFSTTLQTDWIPEAVSSVFIDEYQLERKVPQLFREIRMNTNPFNLSVKTSSTEAKLVAEGASLVADSFSTSKIQFDAFKLQEYYIVSSEVDEDVAPDILRIAREELTESQIRAMEQVMLNGDNSGTHMDDDTDGGAANLAAKAQKGLRKLAIANSANGSLVTFSSGVTTAKLDEMRTASGKFGIAVRDLAYIMSPTTYHQSVNLDEVSSLDRVGNAATLLTGALAFFRGAPIVISEKCRENVSASGVNTGAGPNDKGVIYLVNKRRFFVGMRRPIRIRVMPDLPGEDRFLLSSLTRWDFKGHAQGAGEVSSVLGIDITV